jgi:hypothetical protein
MSSHTQPCEYEYCKCTVTGELDDAAYCSAICKARDTDREEMEENCECGHPPCDAE